VLVAVVARANAPPDQYAPFDPQAQAISDLLTHLQWERFVKSGLVSHAMAQSYCAGQGMRLPTYRELLTLVDEDPHGEWDPDAGMSVTVMIDPNAFPSTPPAAFWSMSPGTIANHLKVVTFDNGATTDRADTDPTYVRCVLDQ
jgi:hypothetical protein